MPAWNPLPQSRGKRLIGGQTLQIFTQLLLFCGIPSHFYQCESFRCRVFIQERGQERSNSGQTTLLIVHLRTMKIEPLQNSISVLGFVIRKVPHSCTMFNAFFDVKRDMDIWTSWMAEFRFKVIKWEARVNYMHWDACLLSRFVFVS